MGNQAFQIATTIATSLKHNVPYCIPAKTIGVERAYFDHFISSINIDTNHFHAYKEKTHAYTEIPYKKDQYLLLDGYFQSERYFRDYREEIISAFEPAFGKYKKRSGWVAIHVRRGDYLENGNLFNSPSIDYLTECIMHFIKLGYKNYLVCSDDMEWCLRWLNKELFGVNFEYHQGTEFEDISDMKDCEHMIMSASSFSWWAAWLNENQDKIVIYPKQWFGYGNRHLDTSDLCPEEWVAM